VVSIWAGTTGHLDDVPLEDVRRFEHEFLENLKPLARGLLTSIRETKDLTDDNITTLKDAIEEFRKSFETTAGELLVRRGRAGRRSLEHEVSQETIQARRVPQPSKDGKLAPWQPSFAWSGQRIRAVQSIAKITRAQELIASSRIVRAQQQQRAAEPYSRELTRAVEAVISRSTNITHPFTTEPEHPTRAAVLILTSDQGFAGAYNANVLRESARLRERLRQRGVEPVLYVAGRKGISWHRFRELELAGVLERVLRPQPRYRDAKAIADVAARRVRERRGR
jgi:hypothetical protein